MSDEAPLIFGDAEPEDAWHPDDPVAEQITNLIRRARLLADLDDHILDVIVKTVRRARRRGLNERGKVRADQLEEDVALVRSRL